mmetsp:Transcript_30097/g.87670  ORF Transcript_30097/g.87670 Transcript_30097/m.87670 type:complete len:291 (+) Transcript_30097:1186-2058(+)
MTKRRTWTLAWGGQVYASRPWLPSSRGTAPAAKPHCPPLEAAVVRGCPSPKRNQGPRMPPRLRVERSVSGTASTASWLLASGVVTNSRRGPSPKLTWHGSETRKGNACLPGVVRWSQSSSCIGRGLDRPWKPTNCCPRGTHARCKAFSSGSPHPSSSGLWAVRQRSTSRALPPHLALRTSSATSLPWPTSTAPWFPSGSIGRRFGPSAPRSASRRHPPQHQSPIPPVPAQTRRQRATRRTSRKQRRMWTVSKQSSQQARGEVVTPRASTRTIGKGWAAGIQRKRALVRGR